MTRGYLRLLPGLRDSASMIGAKSVPALASTYSTPRSARRGRKDSAVMRAAGSGTEHVPRFGGGWWLAAVISRVSRRNRAAPAKAERRGEARHGQVAQHHRDGRHRRHIGQGPGGAP